MAQLSTAPNASSGCQFARLSFPFYTQVFTCGEREFGARFGDMKQVKSCISEPLHRRDRSSKRFDSGAVMKLDQKLLNRHRALEKLRKHIALRTFHAHFQQVDLRSWPEYLLLKNCCLKSIKLYIRLLVSHSGHIVADFRSVGIAHPIIKKVIMSQKFRLYSIVAPCFIFVSLLIDKSNS